MNNQYCGCKFCEVGIRKSERKKTILVILGILAVVIAFGLLGRMERNIELMPDTEPSTGEYDYFPL